MKKKKTKALKAKPAKNKFFQDIKEGLQEAIDYARGKIALRTTEFQSSPGDQTRWEQVGSSVERMYSDDEIREWTTADQFKDAKERRRVKARLKHARNRTSK